MQSYGLKLYKFYQTTHTLLSVCFFLQDFMHLSKEVTSLRDALTEREDEVHELKAERNNTRVSIGLLGGGGEAVWPTALLWLDCRVILPSSNIHVSVLITLCTGTQPSGIICCDWTQK